MTPDTILQKFMEYVHYEPDQTSFNLLSDSYIFHNACKNIENNALVFDPSGQMAVLYARKVYNEVLRSARVPLLDVLCNEEEYKREKEMYELFNSEEINSIEKNYVEAINSVITKVIGREAIGERDLEKEKENMYQAVEAIVEHLGQCIEEVYVCSGKPVTHPERNISTRIYVFNYLGECIVNLQSQAPDGTYLCYINQNGTADGYFAIMIKSNGNLFSINDRAQERFIGQHQHSRNGRWAEAHKDDVFPYEFIMKFDNYDYKGYARSYQVQEDKLEFKNIEPAAYTRVILAMFSIANTRNGLVPDKRKQVYTNVLIRGSLSAGEEKALINIDGTEIIDATTSALSTSTAKAFDREELLKGNYDKEFETNTSFKGRNQALVSQFAGGFTVESDPLKITTLALTDESGETETSAGEFVGSADEMRRQAYYVIRKNMAAHIRKEIRNEIEKAGGEKAIRKWYEQALVENKSYIEKMLTLFYSRLTYEKDRYVYVRQPDDPIWFRTIGVDTGKKYAYAYNYKINDYILNPPAEGQEYSNNEYMICPVTGNAANIWFNIRPFNAEILRELAGKELPTLLKYWKSDRFTFGDVFGEQYAGNPLLDLCDPVEFVNVYIGDSRWSNNSLFDFYAGYSKRGITRLVKEAGLGKKEDT